MKHLFTFLFFAITLSIYAQTDSLTVEEIDLQLDESELIKSFSKNACDCIESVKTKNRQRTEIVEEISACIDQQVDSYQLLSKLNKTLGSDGDKTIQVQVNKNSNEYKAYYYEIERDLMETCESMKIKIMSNDLESNNSVSSNAEAKRLYDKGVQFLENQKYEKAITEFQKALDIDDQFAFAWDNLGLAYRQLGDFDKAIEAYNRSLIVEPSGTMPLQNLAVAYLYKKDYDNSIKMYEELAKRDDENPEVYYGLAIVYLNGKEDYELALRNMCQAYNLYVSISSPYRTDAESIISSIYQEYEKNGKEDQFMKILKEYNISTN